MRILPRFIIVNLFLVLSLFGADSFALSEYGLTCQSNKDCVKCTQDIDCIKCMHKCWNSYGYADSNLKGTTSHSEGEGCQLRRAKWCNAQCWDPDDYKKPDYVSTKPSCNKESFYFPPGGVKFSKNKPKF